MEELRVGELAAGVAAWHNRHPLAQRITPAQVTGIGWVAVPFAQRPGAPVFEMAPPATSATAPPLRLRDRARAAEGAGSQAAQPAEMPVLQAQLPWPQRLLVQMKMAWQAALGQRRRLRQRRACLQPAFSEDFIHPVSPRSAAQWALRHGLTHAQLAGLPLREVLPDPAWGRQGTGLITLYLASAAVEAGSRRTRILLAPGGRSTPLGPRLTSARRGAAVLAVLLAVGLGLAQPALPPLPAPADWPGVAAAQTVFARWSALAQGEPQTEEVAVAEVAEVAVNPVPVVDAMYEPAASAALPEEVVPLTPMAPEMPTLTADPTPADSHAAAHEPLPDSHAQPAVLPPDDPPAAAEPFRPGRRLVAPLDEATKAAAKDAVASLRAERGLPEPAPPVQPAVAALKPRWVDPELEAAPSYALTSRVLRTRAESEQVQTAVRALLAQHTAEPLLVELMPAGDDWRVVCWPFSRRQDAQLARALLLTRGLRMEPIEF